MPSAASQDGVNKFSAFSEFDDTALNKSLGKHSTWITPGASELFGNRRVVRSHKHNGHSAAPTLFIPC